MPVTNDTYHVPSDVVIENPNEGFDTVIATIDYRLPANVERLILQGAVGVALQGYGNTLDNELIGHDGTDLLNGEEGADHMAGGKGDDVYFVDNSGDVVIENVGEGNDTIYSSIGSVNPLQLNVENLVLTGVMDLQGIGNDANNIISGNVGSNVLNGGVGADWMIGGIGDDTYFVDTQNDVVTENFGEGIDTVRVDVHYRLPENVENLTLLGSNDLQGYGNTLNNIVTGNVGDNLIDGGIGADTMRGGNGNDAYFVDNAGDVIIENAGEGNDTAYVTTEFYYALPANVENLVVFSVVPPNTGANVAGNDLSNALVGASNGDFLDGKGGADWLVGGKGDDRYFVNSPGDVVTENANEGLDTVVASTHYRLPANVENLIFGDAYFGNLGNFGDLQGYGNDLDNEITGGFGSNLLDGGTGNDILFGGGGNDVYLVRSLGAQVIEGPEPGNPYDSSWWPTGGNDTVFLVDDGVIDYTLPDNVENLVIQGTLATTASGNASANKMYGNNSDNALNGGAGADVLQGNGGDDVFVFHVGQATGDTVVDFAGNGAAAGDSLQFVGYGQGATFTQNDPTHWQVNYNNGTQHEIITFITSASVNPIDVLFV